MCFNIDRLLVWVRKLALTGLASSKGVQMKVHQGHQN